MLCDLSQWSYSKWNVLSMLFNGFSTYLKIWLEDIKYTYFVTLNVQILCSLILSDKNFMLFDFNFTYYEVLYSLISFFKSIVTLF